MTSKVSTTEFIEYLQPLSILKTRDKNTLGIKEYLLALRILQRIEEYHFTYMIRRAVM